VQQHDVLGSHALGLAAVDLDLDLLADGDDPRGAGLVQDLSAATAVGGDVGWPAAGFQTTCPVSADTGLMRGQGVAISVNLSACPLGAGS
jgi:hypothetical protein